MIAIEVIRILSIYWIIHLFFSGFLNRKNYRPIWFWVGALVNMSIFFALGISENVFVNFISSYVMIFAMAVVFYKEKLIKLAVFSVLFNFIGLMSDLFIGAIIITVTHIYAAEFGEYIRLEFVGLIINAVIFVFVMIFRKLFKGKRYYDSTWDLLTMAGFLILSAVTMLTVFRLLFVSEIPIAEHIAILFVLPALLFSSIIMFFQYNNAVRRKELEMELAVNKDTESHRQTIIRQHEKNIDEKNAILHDYKNSITHLAGIINNPEKALAYCNELSEKFLNQLDQYKFDVNNDILSVALGKLKYDCERNDIALDLKIQHTDFSPIKSVDTSSLFGNLFDNAVAACLLVSDKKWIHVIMSGTEDLLYVEVKNSRLNKIVETGGEFLSTKRNYDNKGSGVGIIKSIAEKYNGEISISYDDDSFTCFIFISKEND